MIPEVDAYLARAGAWHLELEALHALLLDCGLTETLKWRQPCYTLDERNVASLSALKHSCSLAFFKGALLQDSAELLVAPGPSSRSVRAVRFTDVREILAREDTLSAYVFEAIEVERAGLSVPATQGAEPIPIELARSFDQHPRLETAFRALTPGRQRGYLLHFSQAKRAETRTARVERYTPRILDGKGITDCVCGLSRKMPGCDGSHKYALVPGRVEGIGL